MAKTTQTLVTGAAVLLVGLILGAAAMTPTLAALEPEAPYTLRPDLEKIAESPRVAILTRRAAEPVVPIRGSEPLASKQGPWPIRLVIPTIGVDAAVTTVGLEDRPGGGTQLGVPPLFQAGWYSHGSTPNQPGATVLAGHVDYDGLAGVFWRLDELTTGDEIEVHLSDGSVATYRAVRTTQFARQNLSSQKLFGSTGPPALHLITCGGSFDHDLGSYDSNYVVTAAPISGDT